MRYRKANADFPTCLLPKMTSLIGTSNCTEEKCASEGYKIREDTGLLSLVVDFWISKWCNGGTRGACGLYKNGDDQVLLIFLQCNSDTGEMG